jgi:hypothetical protein
VIEQRVGRCGLRISAGAAASSSEWPWGLPRLLYSLGTEFPFWGVKRPGTEIHNLLLPCAEVKNWWSYTSSPPICLDNVDKDNVTCVKFVNLSRHGTYSESGTGF